MSNSSNIRINIEKFRAINNADISINGITVVAGENGCGKSTISKILYYVFKTSSNYNYLVGELLCNKLSDVLRFLEISIRELFSFDRQLRNEYSKDLNYIINRLENEEPNEILLRDMLVLIDKINLTYALVKKKDQSNSNRRLIFIASDILKEEYDSFENSDIPFEQVKLKIINFFKEAFGYISSRNNFMLKEEFNNVFHTQDLPKKLEVYEIDDLLVSLDKNHISIPYGIQNVIYIDSPMMLGEFSEENQHWNELNHLLMSKEYNSKHSYITNIISSEILNGDVSYEDDILSLHNFSFKRNDGAVFNLLDCATGIKSFSIIQLLLKLGHINSKTLLIVDEPESHLHPQWIVEYARIMVLINKRIGAKFFIASHNPDLISAVRYISEKEGLLNVTNFYLAKQQKSTFDYISLQKNIDPIFESFNIALDRIDKYGI